ncbi:MAG: hypothetical protein AB8W78_10795 [Arsenophonus endosymbiont of Dermacentor nuttalli]
MFRSRVLLSAIFLHLFADASLLRLDNSDNLLDRQIQLPAQQQPFKAKLVYVGLSEAQAKKNCYFQRKVVVS